MDTQLVMLGGCPIPYMQVQPAVTFEMEAREEHQGPHLLSKWSACEEQCLGSGLVARGFPPSSFYGHLKAIHQSPR